MSETDTAAHFPVYIEERRELWPHNIQTSGVVYYLSWKCINEWTIKQLNEYCETKLNKELGLITQIAI